MLFIPDNALVYSASKFIASGDPAILVVITSFKNLSLEYEVKNLLTPPKPSSFPSFPCIVRFSLVSFANVDSLTFENDFNL